MIQLRVGHPPIDLKGEFCELIQKRIDEIDKPTIDALVTNNVSERRTLDYKELLPGSGDEDKREFLSDVASFANASGGDIVFGVADERDESGRATGVPCSAEGLNVVNIGEHKARLEASARDGIAPRIQGIEFQIVNGFVKGPVLVVRVPRSWAGPHMVTFKNLSRFYSRNSTGKYQLDVSEIRSAFVSSVDLAERLLAFRAERVSKVLNSETHKQRPTIILHLVPISGFGSDVRDVARQAEKLPLQLKPITATGWDGHFNFEGYLVFAPLVRSHVQVFRSGVIEAIDEEYLTPWEETSDMRLDAISLEQEIVSAIQRYLEVQRLVGLPLPIMVMLTLLGVKGYSISTPNRMVLRKYPIDRDVLPLPEMIFDDYSADVPKTARTTFEALWQACGYGRSLNYDQDGNWKRLR